MKFRYFNGRENIEHGLEKMYEFAGGGVAIFDYDGDSLPDIFFTQGCRWPPGIPSASPELNDRLFRNLGDATFADVTFAAGLQEAGFGQGTTVGDFDSDGWPDLFVSNIGQNRLYRNKADGTFSEISQSAGVRGHRWRTSAALVDLNGDPHPDLYVVNYLGDEDVFTRVCGSKEDPAICLPQSFTAEQDRLYLNLGDGRFQDVTERAGIQVDDNKGLGVVAADFTDDGRLDMFVANDTVMNFLFINQTPIAGASPQFSEEGLARGVALNGSGKAEGCMGIAVDDANADGRLDLFITNFHQETNTLYLQMQPGLFRDETQEANLANSSLTQLGFGTQFLDADLDGRPDLMATNGHIDDLSAYGRPYKMPSQFFYNLGSGRFRELPPQVVGEFFDIQALGRGMAKCDWNRDGKEDVVISYLDRPAVLLTNRTEQAGRFIAFQFCGVQSSRDAHGLKVLLTADGISRTLQLTADGGYQASNQKRLVAGLGAAVRVETLKIEWPSGHRQHFQNLPANREWVIRETADQPLLLPNP